MKRLAATLSAAALLATFSLAARADQFSQIQNSPNTYWVPAPSGSSNSSQANSAPSSDPKQMQAPSQAPQQAPRQGPQGYYYPAPGYAAAPPPGYYPPGYVVAPPPGYYAPRPYYYGPPIAAGYYGGPHGNRVFIGIPGLFLGFHFH